MKVLTTIALTAAFLAASPAFAAKEGKNDVRAQREVSCKAQAAKKFSAIHFIKRSNYVNQCMGVTTAKAKKAGPTTTGQATH